MLHKLYKEVYFESAHRLLHYEGKCNRIHGHQFRVEVWLEGEVDPTTQILVDYNVLKQIINRFDHQIILNHEDPMVPVLSTFQRVITTTGDPTSELLARLIADEINTECGQEKRSIAVTKIRVWESTSSYAEVSY